MQPSIKKRLEEFGLDNGVYVTIDMHPDRTAKILMLRHNDHVSGNYDEAHLEEQLERLLWDLNSKR